MALIVVVTVHIGPLITFILGEITAQALIPLHRVLGLSVRRVAIV